MIDQVLNSLSTVVQPWRKLPDGVPLCNTDLSFVHWVPTVEVHLREMELEVRNHNRLASWRSRYWDAGVVS